MGKDQKGKELGKGISQRQDGLYTARFTDQTGKRRQKYFKKLAECRQWLADAQFADEHSNIFKGDITVDAWFQYWIDEIKGDSIRYSTKLFYCQQYHNQIQPVLGKMLIKDVRPLHCQSVLNKMSSKSYAQSSITAAKTVMGTLLGAAYNNNVIMQYPLRNVKPQNGQPSKKKKVLTVDEQKTLLTGLRSEWYYEAYALVLQTGLRAGELRALRWSDIDFEQNTIHINKTMSRSAQGGSVAGEPKTYAGLRSIPLTQEAINILNSQKEKRSQIKVIPMQFADYIFLTHKGKPNDTSAYDLKLDAVTRKLGIPHISMHTLRHTFATRCIEGGMKPKTLQKLLGHSNIETTLNLYVHLTEDEKIKEMQDIEQVLKVV